eukprot:scaffold6647_cov166-Amphora_coffeaeformis.AAC.2
MGTCLSRQGNDVVVSEEGALTKTMDNSQHKSGGQDGVVGSSFSPKTADTYSSSSSYFSPYLTYQHFRSPLSTVIVEEEDQSMQPSDEEDDDPILHTPIKTNVSKISLGMPVHCRIAHSPQFMTRSVNTSNQEEAVSQDCVAVFQTLRLSKLMQQKSTEKKRQQNKIETQRKDMETNQQLWQSFQVIQNEVSSMNNEHSEVSSCAGLMNTIHFDFNSVDFEETSSQCSENLSLLSQEGLEVQRQYFEEKRQRKDSKKSMSAPKPPVGGGSVSSFGSKDYGPSRQTVVLRDMEVFVPQNEPAPKVDCEMASYVSDLGDESTIGSNASSLCKYDYAVPHHRKRSAMSHSSKSLRTKLDFLEDAVAGLRESQQSHAMNDESGPLVLDEQQGAAEYLGVADTEESTAFELPNMNPAPTDPLQVVQETSYATGDESSVNSEFGDLRKNASVMINSAPDCQPLGVGPSIAVNSEFGDVMKKASAMITSAPDRQPLRVGPSIAEPKNFHSAKEMPEVSTWGSPSLLTGSMKNLVGIRSSIKQEEYHRGGYSERTYQADSQAKRLLQKSRSYVHSLSTEEFRRMSFGDPFSCLGPHNDVYPEAPFDEDSIEAPEDKELEFPGVRDGLREASSYSVDEAAAAQIPLATSFGITSSDSAPLHLHLVDEVENQMTAVLKKLKQSNEKS